MYWSFVKFVNNDFCVIFWQNRQCYTQMLGDPKASSTKAVPPRMTGKGRGRGETRQPMKDDKVEAISVQEKASSMPDIFKTFTMRFVRLNGILFTRTRFFPVHTLMECLLFDYNIPIC